jgi:acetyl esterase/lipase
MELTVQAVQHVQLGFAGEARMRISARSSTGPDTKMFAGALTAGRWLSFSYLVATLLGFGAPAPLLAQDRFVSWEDTPRPATAAADRIEANVAFGMHSGLALVMDVYYPREANGLGVVWIPGSGFHASTAYDARQLKLDYWTQAHIAALIETGYTVFAVNHRTAPTYRYPAAVEDAQRAVRFIRYHAAKFGVAPDRLGGMGESSGGYLVLMLGILEGSGNGAAADPVERESARLQAIVAFSAPSDLTAPFSSRVSTILGSFLGRPFRAEVSSADYLAYRAASPLAHVRAGNAPTLLVHGDQDEVIPFAQSERLLAAFTNAGVTAQLLGVPGAGHAIAEQPPFSTEIACWFEKHLAPRRR